MTMSLTSNSSMSMILFVFVRLYVYKSVYIIIIVRTYTYVSYRVDHIYNNHVHLITLYCSTTSSIVRAKMHVSRLRVAIRVYLYLRDDTIMHTRYAYTVIGLISVTVTRLYVMFTPTHGASLGAGLSGNVATAHRKS